MLRTMSLFNKPKRNIRRRPFNDDDEDNENRMEVEDTQPVKSKTKKKDKPKQTLLSFGEELEEADDGEVFKVKKSSRSKKLMKQLDHERRKKKGEEKMQMDSEQPHMSVKVEKELEIKTDDLVVKIKNAGPLILNGRAALAAGKDDYTSDEEEDEPRSHKFRRNTDKADTMKILLESGCIPDAAMIHAARKCRQKARELGTDYIPIEEQSDDKGKSRLIREEDHDRSDDDDSQDRIDMTVNTEARDKEKRREAFLASQVPLKLSDDESEHENEEEEWEAQQIRKGVTGAQIAAAQQDSMMQQQYSMGMNVNSMMGSGISLEMVMMPAPPPPPVIQPPDPTKIVPITPQEVVNKMRARLDSLKEVHRRHQLDQDRLEQELGQTVKELDDAEIRAPQLAQRFRYYQELRGYVTDLVECLDEKLPLVIGLEHRWLNLYNERAIELMERRRQDTRDQAEEITTAARGQPIRRGPEVEARIRRATEREGRRARRRRARELAPTLPKHIDGMSSDDEVTEQQNLAFKQTKDEIDSDSKEIFSDVMDEYCTIRGILSKLESWRETDRDAYMEAYVSLCIPKIISPIIRLLLLTWNPIMESADIERTKWYNTLLLYALSSKETEESLKRDPDVRLVPFTIEKIVIPKLTSIVERIWDPMSTSQTLRLVGTVNRLIREYPNLNDTSKPLETLFNAILEKIKSAVENDVFIPIFPKQVLDTKHQFFQRQFAMAVKLLRNLLSWQGLLGDTQLKNLALGSLLNRYLLAGLRVSVPTDALFKANMVMSTLPRAWLQGETIEHLKMFATLIQQLSEQLDQANPAHNHVTNGIFQSGKEYIYSYNALSSSGVLLPSGASSSWGFNGKLKIQAEQNVATMQLESLKMTIWNGKIQEQGENQAVSEDVTDLLKPFQIIYRNGLIENFSTEAISPWSVNIKRSIAGILQLDLSNLEKETAFHSTEKNHYGQCNIEYVVNPEEKNEWIIRKFFDPRTCIGHPHYTWSNVPNMLCPNGDQNPILKSSERLYKIKINGSLNEILFVNASGGIYVQSFQSFGEAHFHFTRQIFKLISVKDTVDKIPIKDLYFKVLQHELPEVDLTQSRGTLDKITVFKSIGTLLDRLSLRLENPGLDTEADNLHNTTITVLLYYLQMLDVADLRNAYTKISGTSYKEETIRNMFLEALPQVGTKEAALFILELIQDKKVSDMSAIQLLTQLPFHIRKPDVQLLVNLQTFLNLPEKISVEVQNTAILTYGTLIYKTCLLYCPYEMLDDYVRLYLDKFTETKEYEKKMIWLEGLANIQLGRVVEFLEPIASGSNAESRHFRVLAAWASLSTAPLRPDVIYPVYWPILINRTEHLEMRVAALTLLIVSSPTPSRLISLYWYMQSEPSQHLYNYFYTILKSMERTTHPCYIHIGVIAAQFTRVLRPTTNSYLITGNYLFDYQDTYRKFGAMIHGIVIANPLTNIPEVLYVTVNTYGNGVSINHVSLYIKAEGLLHSLSAHLDGPTQVKDILKQFKLDEKQNGPVHLEVIARIQEKTVLCLHLNETNIIKGFKYLSSLPDNIYHIYQNMEFHVNQQRINIPLTMESVQVTDLGANARLAVIATSLFSMRGNFTHVSVGRNNHVILRTSIHKSEIIENYNPLIDTWHSAERAHSIHGYLPINITLGFKDRPFISYNTPGEHLKMGITTHVRTSTNIKGLNIKSKLHQICPTCPQLYIITKSPTYKPKTIDLFQFELSELGGQVYVKLFDCENVISREKLIQDVFSSHRANYPIWPFLEFALTALHFLDYYTYVPPKGSCGLAAYISTIDAQRTQVKFEYIKGSNHHMLSLTHHNIESSQILQQWNVAALYEITSWISDTIKIKATKVIPGQKILKFCLEAEKAIPWEWDFLSTKPSDPARIALNAVWGYSDTAKGKCDGSSITLDLLGEISEKQLQIAKESQWPYEECREQSKRKRFTPFSDACYEASRELSTLRKYQVVAQHENIPQNLMRLAWKFRAFYDLIGGNSSSDPNSKKFIVTATFPKGSDIGELSLNNDKVAIEYNYNLIDYFLTRTRIHKYMDLSILKTFFGTCVVTPDYIKSIHNITYPFHNKAEVLLLGQCYSENPKYALTARNDLYGININIYDEIDTVRIIPNQTGGTLYNNTIYIPLPQSFMFHSLGSKRVRLDSNTIDIIIPNLYLYMHWTQEQILLFFPTYLLEFTCGICALGTLDSNNLYEKL